MKNALKIGFLCFCLFSGISVKAQLYGNYELKFTAGTTEHLGLLRMYANGFSGLLRIKYYNQLLSDYTVVEQQVRLENGPNGIRLAGYYPVFANTQISHPGYIADKFYFLSNGRVVNVDDLGVQAETYSRRIYYDWDLTKLCREFNW
ncbi:MAG: hypothetical protein NW226_10765 [Microscillaceae bacterium]|nr:hypothetical protein [Microscillaceae bacterium]